MSAFKCTAILLWLLFSLPVVGDETQMAEEPAFAPDFATPDFATEVAALASAGFSAKEAAISRLAASPDPRVAKLFAALLDGNLYSDKASKDVVIFTSDHKGVAAEQVVTGVVATNADKSGFVKIVVNNKLRVQLRSLVASLQLASADPALRLKAAQELMKTPSDSFLPALETAIAKEADSGVKTALNIARSSILLGSAAVSDRLSAVTNLAEVNDNSVVTQLEMLTVRNADGSYSEPDRAVRLAAEKALQSLHFRQQLHKFAEDIFFGVSLGSVLLLAAVGLAITFGVMGVINMAHGEMIMLGAYTTYVVQLAMPAHLELSLLVAVPAAFVVAGIFGVIIERGVIRVLYGRPLETLLATFGVSLILQQLVRSVFSPLNRSVITPEWMSGSWQVNGMLSLTYNRLYIIVFSLAVLAGLMLLLRKTLFGLQMRAVTQNRRMASSMGIRTGWVDALTFGLGSGIAGIAGVALSQLTNVGPNMGQAYIIDSFMVVVFGGVGNLLGTFVGAMGLGVVNKFAEPLAGAVLAKIIILVFIILFIQRRPRGLFALKGRFVED
ncbi:MAG: urea ABC transporter permease subunit UrtB [Porticoccaceae bacterium]